MKKTTHKLLTPTLMALAVSTALTGNTALAQDTQADEEIALERIEVSARRTIQNLQEIPIAVSSLGADQIAERGIATVTDVQQYVPNTTLQVSRGTNTTLTAFIRGIGQQDPLWGFEPGVGIYIDDVYVARPQGAVLDVLDIERIEVLRGPQGTLYGKNTIGGAVKYVTKSLSGENELNVRAGVGNYGQRNFLINGQTSITDKLFVGFAAASLNRDGFGTFVNTGDENYNKDIVTGRLTVEYHASDDLKIRFMADQTQDDSNARGGHRLTTSALNPARVPFDNVFDSETSLPVDNEVETRGMSLTVDWNINDNMTFRSITARRLGETDTNIDFDATTINSADVPAVYRDDQTTQEFQFLYNSENFNLVSGLYYYTGRAAGAFDVQLGIFGLTLENGGFVDTDSYSIYAEGDYALDDDWTLIFGGRYNYDDKEAFVYRQLLPGIVFPNDGVPRDTSNGFTADENWGQFTPKVGVQYQADDDTMYYATYTKGFKSGGFNMRADISADPEGNQPFDPEIVDTYEAGFKTEFLNNRIRMNGAVFYNDYTDIQVTVQRAVPAGDSFVARVVNAGESSAVGAELETIFSVTSDLNWYFTAGYINAQFDEFLDTDQTTGEIVDLSNEVAITNTPKWSINSGFDYTFDSYQGYMVLTGNVSYRSPQFIFEIPSQVDMGSYAVTNMSLNYFHDNDKFTASLHVRNLFDKEYRIAGYNFANLGLEEVVTGFYGDPRTVEFVVGYRF